MTVRARDLYAGIPYSVAGARLAVANPMMPQGPHWGAYVPEAAGPLGPVLPYAVCFLLFPLEGLLIVSLAWRSSAYRSRFVLAWTGVTTATFATLCVFLAVSPPHV